MMDKLEMISLARQKAQQYGLDPALVCAVIEQESNWNPWAVRYEPGFMKKYIGPLYVAGKLSATEAYSRCFSWGLMQVMGQVAREEGFTDASISQLCDPAIGIDAGCRHLAKLGAREGIAVEDKQKDVLLRWNGGGNPDYPAEVLKRVPAYNAAAGLNVVTLT